MDGACRRRQEVGGDKEIVGTIRGARRIESSVRIQDLHLHAGADLKAGLAISQTTRIDEIANPPGRAADLVNDAK